jgi:phage terminase large subunit-like protein
MDHQLSGVYFDARVADHIERFASIVKLTKGTKSGRVEPFRLLPHQRKWLVNLLGWKRPDGTRLYRQTYFSQARKNSKTYTAAFLSLYLLTCDDEVGPEIYMSAKSLDQAAICYSAARDIVMASEELSDCLTIVPYKKRIINRANNGEIIVLSAEGKTKHGHNPSTVIFDELHVWGPAERELYAALTTGSVARRQPLFAFLTTAGDDHHSLCREEYDYSKRLLSGDATNPSYLPMIYEVPTDADWRDESLWHLANPSLGEIVTIESLREAALKAKDSPARENEFRRLHLNQWVQHESPWIALERWDECAGDDKPAPGDICYAGLDLSGTTDLSALAMVFPRPNNRLIVRVIVWVPDFEIRERSARDRVDYATWIRDGWIKTTKEGLRAINARELTADVLEILSPYDVRMLAYDRYGAGPVIADLTTAGVRCVDYGQGYVSMSYPTKELERRILNHELVHDGNPVLRWNVACVTLSTDAAGNVKPVKPDRLKYTKRIDGVVALIMAIAMIEKQDDGSSVYEWRDVLEVG